MADPYVIPLDQVSMADVSSVGGKNASLGEMIQHLSAAGVNVPGGFATTAHAFRTFLSHNGLTGRIEHALSSLDVEDVAALARTGKDLRVAVESGTYPQDFEQALRDFVSQYSTGAADRSFAVRSSATAEDLPDASFAGQQETLLNVRGVDGILAAVKKVFASLYNDRAIAYRVHKGFIHGEVALSAGIQSMVRSDRATSGVIFTLDTESGFRDVVFITAAYGLGETVVQGAVNPDEFYVHKPMLALGRSGVIQRRLGSKALKMVYADAAGEQTATVDTTPAERNQFCVSDAEVTELARQAVQIEKHYGRPMDIEWAKDGVDGKLYIVQARPETVKSGREGQTLTKFRLADHSDVLVKGRSIGQRIGAGPVKVVLSASEMGKVNPGDVLVTDMTDPDWEPIMKRAAAIVTNRGGRTCHAAIVARELGIPAVVGADGATETLVDGQSVTVSCAEGDIGYVYEGKLDYIEESVSYADMPELPVKIMMNVGNPERAFDFQFLPNHGVGLARLEFIIARTIGIHPRAVLEGEALAADVSEEMAARSSGYGSARAFYVDKLAEGVATLAAAFWPKPVIVRLSDFKSNEYANLLGGRQFEPEEENPMLGFRGAARYIDPAFRACFELECQAMKQVRENMGYTNVQLMIPFVRTLEEAKAVIDLMAAFGLRRGENELKIVMMCEIPANVLLADAFLDLFDGFSIGSNDLTQLTLGVDRDSALVAKSFDERNDAVRILLRQTIQSSKRAGKYVGICGQAPSDHPDLAEWLAKEGIDSLSLNPDSVVETWLMLKDRLGSAITPRQ